MRGKYERARMLSPRFGTESEFLIRKSCMIREFYRRLVESSVSVIELGYERRRRSSGVVGRGRVHGRFTGQTPSDLHKVLK